MILLTNDSRAIAVYNEISQLIVYLPRSSNGRALLLHGRDGSSILSRGTSNTEDSHNGIGVVC